MSNEKQSEADFYMDQFMNDFPGQSLGLGVDVMDPLKVITAIKDYYSANGKNLKPFWLYSII